MNTVFDEALRFILKLDEIPLGGNLLPIVLHLLESSADAGFHSPIFEGGPSVERMKMLSSNCPFGQISIDHLCDRWLEYCSILDPEVFNGDAV